jgi:GTP-binding protein EngB required for normal cell division
MTDQIPSHSEGKSPLGASLLPWIAALAGRVGNFRKDLLAADSWAPAAGLGVELDRALSALEVPPSVPALVVMLGGTGVGKSELFNALIDRPGASPSSDTVRCHTSQPFLAVHPLDRAHLPSLQGLEPMLVEGGVPRGVVLADTPDIDGMIERHHGVTRQVLERADLVLFVTDPDRRANLQVLEELRRWAPRKRWLFVLTKADKYADTIDAIARDFAKRVGEIGFAPDRESQFVVASVRPSDAGIERLRQAVLRPGDENRMPLLRQDAFLRQAAHALAAGHLHPFQMEADKLGALADRGRARQEQAYWEALSQPRAADAFARVVKQSAWKEMGERSGAFLFPAVWARARMQPLATGWALTRGLRGGLLGVVGALGASALWALRGLSPLRHIAEALGESFRDTLSAVEHDARRALEDAGLDRIGVAGSVKGQGNTGSVAAKAEVPLGLGEAVDGFLKQWTLSDVHPELLGRVEQDVETAGRESARLATSGFGGVVSVFLGNALVAGMVGWVAWRLGKSWWLETDLSTSFFLQAATLVVVSLLPGMLFLAWRLANQVHPRRLRGLLGKHAGPIAGGQLELVRETLAGWFRQGSDIAKSLEEAQRLLSADLGADATWGTSLPARSAQPASHARKA